jgi:CRP/FNR family transcriptional regulator, cyclic AMP receptor protein
MAYAMDQVFKTFSERVLFRHLERGEKEALFTCVKFRDFAAGETIWVIGAPGDCRMVVLQGTVQISLPGRPRVTLSFGEIFGEISLLDGKERLADVITITGCSLAILDRYDLLAFLEQNPGAWQKIVSALYERLRQPSSARWVRSDIVIGCPSEA